MEDLEGKAEPGDTGVFEVIDKRCTKCGGQLKYLTGEAKYKCNRCDRKYSPSDIIS